ncbi:hypothetical protein V8G54_025040 [Vigna mungo]|uniref:Uncharacterized protein n=1 Tax=Vigna mungo TaxID=3915 RepID=A0AAQ3RTQ8_VIGMU
MSSSDLSPIGPPLALVQSAAVFNQDQLRISATDHGFRTYNCNPVSEHLVIKGRNQQLSSRERHSPMVGRRKIHPKRRHRHLCASGQERRRRRMQYPNSIVFSLAVAVSERRGIKCFHDPERGIFPITGTNATLAYISTALQADGSVSGSKFSFAVEGGGVEPNRCLTSWGFFSLNLSRDIQNTVASLIEPFDLRVICRIQSSTTCSSFGGSQENDFRKPRPTQEVRKLTLDRVEVRKLTPDQVVRRKEDQKIDFEESQEVRKLTPDRVIWREEEGKPQDVRKLTPDRVIWREEEGRQKNDFQRTLGRSQKNDSYLRMIGGGVLREKSGK